MVERLFPWLCPWSSNRGHGRRADHGPLLFHSNESGRYSMKIFTVTSKLKSEKYGDLTIHWFIVGREMLLDCTQFGIPEKQEDEPWKIHQKRRFIHECFSEDEVKLFRDYLKQTHADDLEAVEVPVPVPDWSPFSQIGEGSGDRLIMLNSESTYTLPFKIWGHYYLYENMEEQEDPDFTFKVEDGFVETAGGEPVGLAGDEGVPLDMLLKHLEQKDKSKESDN